MPLKDARLESLHQYNILDTPPEAGFDDIVRVAAVMGPLSSIFDLATFGMLFGVFHSGPAVFRTGWFLESIATQTLVVFLIRTRGRFWRDKPSLALTLSTLGALAVALLLPFSPLGPWFGFQATAPIVTGALGLIVLAYLVAAEALKPLAIRGDPAAMPI